MPNKEESLLPQHFGSENNFSDEQIQEAARRRVSGVRGVPNFVVSTRGSKESRVAQDELKRSGFYSGSTEGGFQLDAEELVVDEKFKQIKDILAKNNMKIKLGITDTEEARNFIRQLNNEKRQQKKASQN